MQEPSVEVVETVSVGFSFTARHDMDIVRGGVRPYLQGAGIQGEFLDAFAESLVGSRLPVLIEQYDEEADFWIGRSYADSPEIDSMVYVRGSCSPGDMPTVLVESAENGILVDVKGVLRGKIKDLKV